MEAVTKRHSVIVAVDWDLSWQEVVARVGSPVLGSELSDVGMLYASTLRGTRDQPLTIYSFPILQAPPGTQEVATHRENHLPGKARKRDACISNRDALIYAEGFGDRPAHPRVLFAFSSRYPQLHRVVSGNGWNFPYGLISLESCMLHGRQRICTIDCDIVQEKVRTPKLNFYDASFRSVWYLFEPHE